MTAMVFYGPNEFADWWRMTEERDREEQLPSLLSLATMLSEGGVVSQLVSDVNVTDLRYFHGKSLLHLAALSKNPEIIRKLVERGATVHDLDKSGNTPLHEAARSNTNVDVLSYLLPDDLVSLGNKRSYTPLHEAARMNSNPQIVKYLLDNGASVTAVNEWGNTPLHEAARMNRNAQMV